MKTIFFDLDETLFDHRYASQMGLAALQQKYTKLQQVPVAELETVFWEIVNSCHMEILEGKITPGQGRLLRLTTLYQQFQLRVPETELVSDVQLYREFYLKSRRPVPGMPEILRLCKFHGLTIAIITNNFHVEQRDKLQACHIQCFIDHLITPEQTRVAKPDPAIFRYAMQLCEVTPQEVIMVGDSWEGDILGAHALGIRSIWLNRRKQPCPDSGITSEIYEASELQKLLFEKS